jgi:hypothetical protein
MLECFAVWFGRNVTARGSGRLLSQKDDPRFEFFLSSASN